MKANTLLAIGLCLTSACSQLRSVSLENYDESKAIVTENSALAEPGAMQTKANEVCGIYKKKAFLVKSECAAGGGAELLSGQCAKRGWFACN